MRSIIWSLTLITCLSLLASADTIDYSGAGTLSAGTAHESGSIAAGKTWSVITELVEITNETTGGIQQGNLGSVDLVSGTLSKCASGFCFLGGDLDIRSSSGSVLFKEAFTSGTISQIAGNVFVNAVLAEGATVLLKSPLGAFSSDSTITTLATTTPEASSLFLLGSGLVGLWWCGREKLKTLGKD